jgi:DnaJ-class molecular chaperone
MTTYKYFNPTPKTLEALKAGYRRLAMANHPDKGGNSETMKAINNEYDQLIPRQKDVHQTKEGETYTARQESTETADQFKDLITELMVTLPIAQQKNSMVSRPGGLPQAQP